MERVALSHQKLPRDGLQFLQDNERSWKGMKKISTVGAVTRNTKTPIKPVLDPNRFSTWNKLILPLATFFKLIYRAKKNRSNKSQYTKEDVCLSQNFLLKLAQNNAFSSTINALKRTQKLVAKTKLRNLIPIIDQNGLLRSPIWPSPICSNRIGDRKFSNNLGRKGNNRETIP